MKSSWAARAFAVLNHTESFPEQATRGPALLSHGPHRPEYSRFYAVGIGRMHTLYSTTDNTRLVVDGQNSPRFNLDRCRIPEVPVRRIITENSFIPGIPVDSILACTGPLAERWAPVSVRAEHRAVREQRKVRREAPQ